MDRVTVSSPSGIRDKSLSESTQFGKEQYEFIRTMRDEVLSTTDAYLFAGLMNVSISEIIRKGDDIMPINKDFLTVVFTDVKEYLRDEQIRMNKYVNDKTVPPDGTGDPGSFQYALRITNDTIRQCVLMSRNNNTDVFTNESNVFFRGIENEEQRGQTPLGGATPQKTNRPLFSDSTVGSGGSTSSTATNYQTTVKRRLH